MSAFLLLAVKVLLCSGAALVVLLIVVAALFGNLEKPEDRTPFGAELPADLDEAAYRIVSKWGYWGTGNEVDALAQVFPQRELSYLESRLALARKLDQAVATFPSGSKKDPDSREISSALRRKVPGLSSAAYDWAAGLVQYAIHK